jgi:hypothetical protein
LHAHAISQSNSRKDLRMRPSIPNSARDDFHG